MEYSLILIKQSYNKNNTMKKTILFLALTFICSLGFSQIVMMNTAASTTVTAFPVDVSPQVGQIGYNYMGAIQITTTSNFNGTTTTDTLEYTTVSTPMDSTWTNTASDWSYVKDNSGNIVVFNLTKPSSPKQTYTANFQTVGAKKYRMIHNKGNASAGKEKIIIYIH
jgi:hypothetical protein